MEIKKRAIILALMIIWDTSLHIVQLFNIPGHPLYPYFPLFGIIGYDVFWSIFWMIGAVLAISLIIDKTKIGYRRQI